MPKSTCVYIDDDEADSRDQLVRRAIEYVREVATNHPELAAQGFSIAVSDERGKVLFEVACDLDRPAATVH